MDILVGALIVFLILLVIGLAYVAIPPALTVLRTGKAPKNDWWEWGGASPLYNRLRSLFTILLLVVLLVLLLFAFRAIIV